MEKLLWPAINLLILVGFVASKTRAPFFRFVSLRRTEIFEGLNRSRMQAEEAARRRREVEAKLATLESEKKAIFSEWKEREAAKTQALRERSRALLAHMRIEAEQNKKALLESTRNAIAVGWRRSVLQAVEQKLAQALTPDAHQKLQSRIIEQIGKGAGTA